MKIAVRMMLCAGIFPVTLFAESTLSVEQRFLLLEARLKKAEKRADRAEAEMVKLKQNTRGDNATTAHAGTARPLDVSLNTPAELRFYGDVEFNADAASRTGSLTSLKTSSNKSWAPGNKERWDINGRILLGVEGIRQGSAGKYAGFNVQPLADIRGKMNLDDAAFFFGQKDNWQVKTGRFEAWDMFPLNQDTFIEYSGNTANDLYSDGYGYIYMMKEARGRSNSGGNLLLSQTWDKWYVEVNTLIEDGSALYVDQRYHGRTMENQKNVMYVRPVVAWRSDIWSVAAAMESNIVNNAYGYTDRDGRWRDQSERTGYGLTMTWNTLKNNPQNGTVVNVNTAYMDAPEETDFSAGINALWHRVELGYIYAHNNIAEFSASGVSEECTADCAIFQPGRYDIHTLHTSWQLPDILDMPNFTVYLGGYASWLNAADDDRGNHQPRYGARVRAKYLF